MLCFVRPLCRKDWSKTVGSLTVNYVPNRDLTVYGSISQGYAAGNFNPGAIDRFAFLNPANMGLANFDGSLIPSDPEDTTAHGNLVLRRFYWITV